MKTPVAHTGVSTSDRGLVGTTTEGSSLSYVSDNTDLKKFNNHQKILMRLKPTFATTNLDD